MFWHLRCECFGGEGENALIQNPLVSVIIPVYNTQDNIIRCLESVCNQTYSNLEVIVIDDGSTDDSLNVINRIAANDKRIVVLHQSNQGAGSARNYGLLVSKGDFLGFVDSDDYISLDMMETMLNKMLIHNASIVECGFIRVDSEQGIETRYPLLDRVTIGRERCCKEYLLRENTTNFNWNKLYKSEIFSDVCFPELKYSAYGQV